MEPEVSYTLSAGCLSLSGTMSVAIGRGGIGVRAQFRHSGSGWQTINTTLPTMRCAANEIKISGSGYVANIKLKSAPRRPLSVPTPPTQFMKSHAGLS